MKLSPFENMAEKRSYSHTTNDLANPVSTDRGMDGCHHYTPKSFGPGIKMAEKQRSVPRHIKQTAFVILKLDMLILLPGNT